jgi:predicted transcriptional regulator
MTDPTEQFIRAFEEIAIELRKRAGRPGSHHFELEAAAARDVMVRRNDALLGYIRDIRNLIQHPKHKGRGHVVQVSPAFVSEVEMLLNHLRSPPTATSVGVARGEIRAAGLQERLGDLALLMKRSGFSHLPILDNRGAVIGVFNEAAVFDYLWSEVETIIGHHTRVEEVLQHCHLDAGHTETFAFVQPNTPIDEIEERFVSPTSPHSRLGALFVTASGKRSDVLQRMITPWDVLHVRSRTEPKRQR